jgi:hypothetical protein
MLQRFVSVTRATLSTLLIGIAGTLGRMFAILRLRRCALGIADDRDVGPARDRRRAGWVPAAIILALQSAWIKALILTGFCSLVIGSIDNVMRPRLVGHDTKMSDLLILFSTLGGIAVFGAIGFIIGPIIAALFVTTWEIFGRAYRDDLDVEPSPQSRWSIRAALAPEPVKK